jgi:uncharacterized protein HemX
MSILAHQQHAFNHSVIRTRLIRAGWAVIRRSDGLRKMFLSTAGAWCRSRDREAGDERPDVDPRGDLSG